MPWAKAQTIKFHNNSGIDITGRQLRIDVTVATFDFVLALANGHDVRFYASGAPLSFYRRSFSPATKTASFDVKLPSCPAGADLELIMYYGDPAAADASSFANTYAKRATDSKTLGLWHLDDGAGAAAANAVGGGEALTLVGGPTWVGDTAFPTGNAVQCDGVNDYLENAGVDPLDNFPDSGTIALTWKPTNARGVDAGGERLFYKSVRSGAPIAAVDIYIDPTTGKLVCSFYRDNALGSSVASIATSWGAGVKHRVLVTWDCIWVYLYIDGVFQSRAARQICNVASSSPQPMTVGAYNLSGVRSNFAAATFDEVVILSRVTHSDEALADAEYRKLIPSKQRDKWVAPETLTLEPEEDYEGHHGGNYGAVLESSRVPEDDGSDSFYYTAVDGAAFTICRATRPDPDTAYTRDEDNPLIGRGAGGAGASENAASSFAVKVGSTTHVFASDRPGTDIDHYTATGGGPFSKVGVALSAGGIPNNTQTGNFGVGVDRNRVPVKGSDGLYHGIVDGYFSDTETWECYHVTSSDFNTWTADLVSGRLDSLQVVATGQFGGLHLLWDGARWHVYQHYADVGGMNGTTNLTDKNLPSLIGHATRAADGDDWNNWVSSSTPALALDVSETPTLSDQVADPDFIERDGVCYLTVDHSSNYYLVNPSLDYEANISEFRFQGTLEELLVEGTPITFVLFEELQTDGFLFTRTGVQLTLQIADFGDGFRAASLIGDARGLRTWSARIDVLPDGTEQVPLVNGQTRADYLWEFYVARKAAGNEPFWIQDPKDDLYYLAEFPEDLLSFEILCSRVYSTGLELRQRRVRGVESPVEAI